MKRIQVLAILMAVAAVLTGCGSPQNVSVDVQTPLQVKQGDAFVITATVSNYASKAQTLVSLDIGDKCLQGIAIVKTEPDHQEATHVPIDNTMSYVFRIAVNPGEAKRVLLHAKALKPGDFNSEIDFCINSDVMFLSKGVRTLVE